MAADMATKGGGSGQDSMSPVSKQLLSEMKQMRESIPAANHRQSIVVALQYVNDPAEKSGLIAELLRGTKKSNESNDTNTESARKKQRKQCSSLCHL